MPCFKALLQTLPGALKKAENNSVTIAALRTTNRTWDRTGGMLITGTRSFVTSAARFPPKERSLYVIYTVRAVYTTIFLKEQQNRR
jgi:hypothetical protein